MTAPKNIEQSFYSATSQSSLSRTTQTKNSRQPIAEPHDFKVLDSNLTYCAKRTSETDEVFERILIVCTGNICRSPCAQTLMEELFARGNPRRRIESAGLAALIGLPMEPTVRSLLLEHRHRPSPEHRARQLNHRMLRQADLVLVMERRHAESLYRITPGARGKTFLLGKWQGEQDIRDPFRRDRTAFEQAYRQIHAAVEAWAIRLSR